jgi:hypothetical protein
MMINFRLTNFSLASAAIIFEIQPDEILPVVSIENRVYELTVSAPKVQNLSWPVVLADRLVEDWRAIVVVCDNVAGMKGLECDHRIL